MSKMKSYTDSDCEFSLFISYAHRDNKANEGWVLTLKNAIYDRFYNLKKGIPLKEIHFSEENGPDGGTLGFELEDRVQRSFAMLLVVGEKYIESDWCEKELALFSKVFPDRTNTRLYIAVMGESYLKIAEKGALWREVVAPDQLWTKMYRDQYTDRPLEHRLNGGGLPPNFRDAAYKIADRLIKEIEEDWALSKANSNVSTTDTSGVKPASWVQKSNPKKPMCVAIGPHTKSFDTRGIQQPMVLLQQVLEAAGADVIVLDRDLLSSYDPVDGTPLRPMLGDVDVLVVPLLDERPLRPDLPGGHASILTREWAALKKPQKSLVWYRPPFSDVPPGDAADTHHLDAFKPLAPVCTTPQALVNLLFGAGASDVIRVYIEKHDSVPMYGLGELLVKAWAEFRKTSGENLPNLKFEAIRISQLEKILDDVPRDVAAIVLLHPKGHISKTSLRDKEKIIEESFPKSSPFYPGLVALVFSPPKPTSDPKPDHSWGDVTVYRGENDVDLELDLNSQAWMAHFLKNMWKQYQKT
jgi:hypothetical protein